MHVITFIFSILEFAMFCYQLIHYLSRPEDRSRFWYLILLFLLIVYNITGGLFPDPKFNISIIDQNIIAYGSGFLMASYFPYFFYKGLEFDKLRFHALYGVPLFLILPYLIFFVILYSLTGNLDFAVRWGMIVPFVYSFIIVFAILNVIRVKYKEQIEDEYPVTRLEAMALYFAISPWVCMTVFAYFQVGQWVEVLFTNLGFVVITVIFMFRSVRRSRIEFERLKLLDRLAPNEEIFEDNLKKYDFTHREMEVIRLIRLGYSYQEISEKLFIAIATVGRHIQNIHCKADVKSRLALLRKLETP
ncbi:helix-turn-helix transcriptional regulator [Pedobacter sp.]|uniref:helix-turn-helix transcriptional regulator n=1 Tax=Pedobacter sp. TaxID=1411316 RepID=UPI002D1FC0BB|nr:helix-turn-helix transcriptional regulator [Pedobacter sp.]